MLSKIREKYINLPIQIRASIWFVVCSFFQKGISVLTTPIFTRLLSTAEYGQYNVFNSWLGIVTVFTTLNLYQGVYAQGLIKYDSDRSRYTSSLQGLTLTLLLSWSGIYVITNSFWNNLFSVTTTQMVLMFIIIWATAIFSFWATEQRVLYSYKKLVFLTLLSSIAKPIISIFLVVTSEDKVTARIFGIAIAELVFFAWIFIYHLRRGKCFFDKKYWLYGLSFNIPLIPHYLSYTVLNNADRIMISALIGDSYSGIYSLSYSLSQIMLLFNSSINQTITPWIYQNIKNKTVKEIGKVGYGSLLFIASINLILILCAPELVAFFAPDAYMESVWCIPPITMSVFFIFQYDLFSKFAFYHEKTKLISAATVIGAVINILLNYIFIPLIGYIAAAYTTLVCYILFSIFHYITMNHCLINYENKEKPFNTKYIMLLNIAFLAIGFLFMFTYYNQIIRYSLLMFIVASMIIKRKDLINVLKYFMTIKKGEVIH